MHDCCLPAKTRVDMVQMVHAQAPAQVAGKGSECLFGRRMTLVAQTANAGRAWQAQLWEDGCCMIALAIFLPSSNTLPCSCLLPTAVYPQVMEPILATVTLQC